MPSWISKTKPKCLKSRTFSPAAGVGSKFIAVVGMRRQRKQRLWGLRLASQQPEKLIQRSVNIKVVCLRWETLGSLLIFLWVCLKKRCTEGAATLFSRCCFLSSCLKDEHKFTLMTSLLVATKELLIEQSVILLVKKKFHWRNVRDRRLRICFWWV